MSEAEPILLGYAAREWWLDRSAGWGAEWKPRAVASAAVEKPLSIDRQVWPSVFDELGVAEPAYTGLYSGLWADLERLEAAARGVPRLAEVRWRLAAFTLLPESCASIPLSEWRGRTVDVIPGRLGEGWEAMGYDIADRDGASALVVMSEAFSSSGHDLAGEVNRWNLLESSRRAAELAAVVDGKIPAHAPFCVYRVWTRPPSPAQTTVSAR
jgi:hypothetical protein